MLCMHSLIQWGYDERILDHRIVEMRGGLLLPQAHFFEHTPILPLRPLWPGFAINTIFYAGVLWLLFAAPGMVKRRIRRFRGRCIHCGYYLRGQPADSNKCPECGQNAFDR